MPELPEAQTVVTVLQGDGIVGRRITAVEVRWANTVGGDPDRFRSAVVGKGITAVSRHGKYIFLSLGAVQALSIHLRMSGRLYVATDDEPLSGYERVLLTLDDSREIRFYDPRKFGRFLFHESLDPLLDRLGVDPVSDGFSPLFLWETLSVRRRRIKALLLDQSVIAGMGNIYTDEALWRAAIHPGREATSLSRNESDDLFEAIRYVLFQGIRNYGTRLGNGKGNFVAHSGAFPPTNQIHLSVYGRTGASCPRCTTPIVRIVVGQRSTHICPHCQHL